jgi:hypothetical protein
MVIGRRELLELLQDQLLSDLEVIPSDKVAAVSRELREIAKELEQMAPAEVSSVDDLAAKRAARRATATG